MTLLAVLLILVLLMAAWIARWVVRGAKQLIARVPPDPLSSPAEYGLPFTEVWFTTQDGLRLHGWFIPFRGVPAPASDAGDWGPPGKGTVIFCHGRFGSKDPDLEYVPWFYEAGYHVFMFDFRGHGRSHGQYCSYGYFEKWDLMAAVALLKAKGQGPIGVLGFSLGGAVAIYTAARMPDLACVVSDCGFVEIKKTMVAGAKDKDYPPVLAETLYALVLWLAGRWLGCNLQEADPIRWVEKISPRPLFLINGGRDQYAATADVQRLFAAAGEPKELWIVPEAEHRRVDDVRPKEYKERLLAFFERHLALQAVELVERVQEA